MAGVVDGEGARAQHKRRTRERIVEVATRLFLADGFTAVSVADIAAAVGVSKMTVFNYFDTKEDILLGQLEAQVADAAEVVRARPEGQSPLTALREHFVHQVQQHDPATGICLGVEVIAFHTLILSTRSLLVRLTELAVRSERALAVALRELPGVDPLAAQVVAAQVVGAQRALVATNFDRVQAGTEAGELVELGVRDAERTFALLASGLSTTDFGRDFEPADQATRR